jgi:hypothetical protein
MGKYYRFYKFENVDCWEIYKSEKEVEELIEQTIDENDIEEIADILTGSDFVVNLSLNKEEFKASLLEQDKALNCLDDWFDEYIREIVEEEARAEYEDMVSEYSRYGE